MVVVLLFGFVAGILFSVMVAWMFETEQISDVGITILTDRDNSVVTVPKYSVIDGDAEQVIESNGTFITENIKTPYVSTKKMMVRCDQKEGSTCTIYLSDEYGPDYFRDVITKKILK